MTTTINRALTIMFLFMLIGTSSFSQDDQHEDIEAFRIAFLTKRLALTPDEAKEFWPVYNKFNDEINGVRNTKRKEQQEATNNFLTMSDDDFNRYIDYQVKLLQNETQVVVKYHEEFKKVLPPRKVALFYKAKEDFTRTLLKRMRDKHKLSSE